MSTHNFVKTAISFALAGIVLASASMRTSAVAAEMTSVFGPMQYTRTTGRPQTITDTFEQCGIASCRIVVQNENADGTNRISSASVALNGNEIVGPKDFNQRVDEIVSEPSGASTGDGVVFSTANWVAAYSDDGGGSFTQLDPTTVFPNDAVGFCCDQIVQYVPSINRFIWASPGQRLSVGLSEP
jgi:hypothetical protein